MEGADALTGLPRETPEAVVVPGTPGDGLAETRAEPPVDTVRVPEVVLTIVVAVTVEMGTFAVELGTLVVVAAVIRGTLVVAAVTAVPET